MTTDTPAIGRMEAAAARMFRAHSCAICQGHLLHEAREQDALVRELTAALRNALGYTELVEEHLAGEGGQCEEQCVEDLAAARAVLARVEAEQR